MADDQGILGDGGVPNLTPVNADAYTIPRSPAQVCDVLSVPACLVLLGFRTCECLTTSVAHDSISQLSHVLSKTT